MTVASLAHALPDPLPEGDEARLVLFAIRRIGAHGLNDAFAASAMLNSFGREFRRPLTMLRVFMTDMAAATAGPISIAPCCCARMTAAESAILGALTRVEENAEAATLLLGELLGRRNVDGVTTSALAVATAFADAGHPIR